MLTIRLKELDLEPGDIVLDLGCGEGRHTHGFHMVEGVHAIGVDIDEPSLRKAIDGLKYLNDLNGEPSSYTQFMKASAFELPFPENAFDVVVCSEVLEHLENYPAALSEMRRVLKPNGRLAITVPHAWPEQICWKLAPPPDGYPFQPGGHIRIFDDVHLKFEIIHNGFSFDAKHHAHGIHSPYWWLKCLFWQKTDEFWPIKQYHRLLVWDLMKKPFLTRALDIALSPVIGKSVALYFTANAK